MLFVSSSALRLRLCASSKASLWPPKPHTVMLASTVQEKLHVKVIVWNELKQIARLFESYLFLHGRLRQEYLLRIANVKAMTPYYA